MGWHAQNNLRAEVLAFKPYWLNMFKWLVVVRPALALPMLADWAHVKLTTPGVEPGLSRPQRDVLTTRRCGRLSCAGRTHWLILSGAYVLLIDQGFLCR